MPKRAGKAPAELGGGQLSLFSEGIRKVRVGARYRPHNDVTLYRGECLELLRSMPAEVADLVVTSPPYNLGKSYEKKLDLNVYVEQQSHVIRECVRVLHARGSICWQVGNYVDKGAIIPLDVALYSVFADAALRMRNRIVWRFEHGLHCTRRFSGRYEVIVWFTKQDDYIFNLDPVRVPQKYPGKKHFKGPKADEYSCNPLNKESQETSKTPCPIP